MKKTVVISFLFLLFANLAACNTWSGLGKDVQQVGRKMEDAGDRRRD